MRLSHAQARQLVGRIADEHGNAVELEARPQRQPGTMNKTEAQLAAHLDLQKSAGVVKAWWFEAVALRIGPRCFWHPDFLIELYPDQWFPERSQLDRVLIVDTKGHVKDDALVKAKACTRYPWPIFHAKWVKRDWTYHRIG